MPSLSEIVAACDEITHRSMILDFPGANNGLQIQNNGKVSKIGAAVDAGIVPFEKAIREKVDFLIVHHGLFWNTPERYTDALYRKLKMALDHNLAVYSSHLPLDAHQEIGNNALLAEAIGLDPVDWFLPHEGTPIALLAKTPDDRNALKKRLREEFDGALTAIEFGSRDPERVAILTGSGRSALPYLRENGTDTLITGELRQEHFNLAQEEHLNLYLCGHYATERYGVMALADKLAAQFDVPSVFINTSCPL